MRSGSESATPREVLRSLLFYPAFYLGSVYFVLAALFALPLSEGLFRRAVNRWARYHRFCARHLLGITVRVEGASLAQPAFYAVRHESFFEAIDMSEMFDLPVVFAKAELLRIPVWGFLGKRYGLVPVDRAAGARALRAMITAARFHVGSGRPLVIFPEGTRVPVGSTPPLQAGFAGLYKLLGMPVVPVAVDSGRLYHRWWKRAGVITYRFGEPIPAGLPRPEIEARVQAAINALNDQQR